MNKAELHMVHSFVVNRLTPEEEKMLNKNLLKPSKLGIEIDAKIITIVNIINGKKL